MHASTYKKGLLILLLTLLFSSMGAAQQLDRKISLNLKNVALGEALKQISIAGGVMFSYSPQVIPVEMKVSVKARNKTIRQVLDDLFRNTDIQYSQVESQVILKVQKKKELPANHEHAAQAAKKRTWVVSGILKDKITGEILIGANAYMQGSSQGTSSNAYGFYSLSLPEGPVHLIFSFIGYQSVAMDLELKSDQLIPIQLEPVKMEIRAVEIQAESREEVLQNGRLTIAKIQPRLLEQMPGVGGDIDIIKSLQAIPGIKSFGDGSSMFYVRGGKSDQNLILVDEAPIYNPAHLFGFVSALAPEAIKDISVYKGDAPAHLGGRLSSVIDIKTKDGNMKRFGFAGNIGPYFSDLALEGPFARDRASWLVTGRVSNLNWMFSNQLVNRTIRMNFYDVHAKMNFQLNKSNRLFVSFYKGRDVFSRNSAVSSKTFGITWDNLLGTLRWNHIFSDRLFSNTTLYLSRYNYYLYVNKTAGDYWKSSVANSGLKMDFSWFLNAHNTVRSGLELSLFRSDPGNVYFTDEIIQSHIISSSQYRSSQYVLYLSNEQTPSKKFNLKYGARIPVWQNFAHEQQFVFDEHHLVSDTLLPEKNSAYATFVRFEPRVIASWLPGSNNVLRLTWGRTYQFIQLLNNSTSPFTSLEPWVPAGPNIKPQRSDLFSLAYLHSLSQSRYMFSAETYYRRFRHSVDYCDHANLLYNPLLEGELRFGQAWSYGVEVLFRKVDGKFTGWVAYTWSRAFSKIEDLNKGLQFPASFDTPHELSVNLSYDTYKRWLFTLNWVYHTGSPVSKPTAFYTYNGALVPYYGEKNNDRLPDYHRLDLSILFRFSKPGRKYQHSLSLNVFNLYGRKNPFSVNYNKFIDANGDFLVPADATGRYEHVPTVISAAGLIPSVNYKFRF